MRRMVRFSGQAGAGFRLKVSAGGCSGTSTKFSIEPTAAPSDLLLRLDGVTVFIEAQSQALLEGATIDFPDTPASSGLVVVGARTGGTCCSSTGAPQMARISLEQLRRRT